MSSTLPPPHAPAPRDYPGDGRRVGHRGRPVAIAANVGRVVLVAAAVTATIVLAGTVSPPKPAPDQLSSTPTTARGMAIMLTSVDPIAIDQGISITPAPGWTLVDRGQNWITLGDADAGARIQVTVKPGGGTDVAAALQGEVDNVVANTSLTNVTMLGGPKTKAVQGSNFQQAARMDYTADKTEGLATTHLLGVFMELLNTSNQLSAFIDYRESTDAPSQIDGNAEAMINSML